MVKWFFLIPWRLFDGPMPKLGYWFHVMQRFTSLNVCGSVTYISWSSYFILYQEDYLMVMYWFSVTHWTETIYVGQWSIFHGPVILPCILTIWWTNIIIGRLDPCDANIYHIKCVGQWPTFHGPVILSYILKTIWWIKVVLKILIQCDTNIVLKLCRSVTYISWSSDFTLYLEDYLMVKCHNWNIGSMWCRFTA